MALLEHEDELLLQILDQHPLRCDLFLNVVHEVLELLHLEATQRVLHYFMAVVEHVGHLLFEGRHFLSLALDGDLEDVADLEFAPGGLDLEKVERYRVLQPESVLSPAG